MPPAKSDLTALAGWSLVKEADHIPEREKMALRMFRNGCEGLIEYAPEAESVPKPLEVPVCNAERYKVTQKVTKAAVEMVLNDPIPNIPPELAHYPVKRLSRKIDLSQGQLPVPVPPRSTTVAGCIHRFDLETHHCMHCGLSYQAAMGAKPCLMKGT